MTLRTFTPTTAQRSPVDCESGSRFRTELIVKLRPHPAALNSRALLHRKCEQIYDLWATPCVAPRSHTDIMTKFSFSLHHTSYPFYHAALKWPWTHHQQILKPTCEAQRCLSWKLCLNQHLLPYFSLALVIKMDEPKTKKEKRWSLKILKKKLSLWLEKNITSCYLVYHCAVRAFCQLQLIV